MRRPRVGNEAIQMPEGISPVVYETYISRGNDVVPEFSDTQAVGISSNMFDIMTEDPDNTNEIHPFQRCDVFSQYLYLNHEGVGNRAVQPPHSGLDVSARVDPVERELVANADLEKIRRAHVNNGLGTYSSCSHAFHLLEESGEVDEKILRSEEQATAERLRRNLADAPPPVTPMVAAALRHLSEESGLFFGATEETVAAKGVHGATLKGETKPTSSAGAFFVQKSNGMLRSILDGRWSNAWFLANSVSFNLFTPDVLKSVIANLRAGEKNSKRTWYAVNLDLRHWFHQIKLPSQYRRFLGIKVPDRHRRGSFWFFPRALPMGWLMAPYIAQCITWSVVLGKVAGSYSPTNPLLKLPLEFLRGRNTPFAWIPLVGGGGIFILLDNILIVSSDFATADAWFQKIVQDCHSHHVILKGVEGNTVNEQKAALRKTCFHKMTCGGKEEFDFLGITWRYDNITIEPKEGETPEMPGASEDEKSWSGTRRDMASILGKLNWFRRAHGITNYDTKHKRLTEAMFRIYAKLTPPTKAEWGTPFVFKDTESINALAEGWRYRASKPQHTLVPLEVDLTPEALGYAITDSATSTQICAAMVYTFKEGFKCPTVNEVKALSKIAKFGKRIAIGELEAILLAVEYLVKIGKKLIILGTDNMNCKHWLEGCPAHDPEIRRILAEIENHLRSVGGRLYTTYIPTRENYADEPSRGLPVVPTKLEMNHILLEAARREAAGYWNIAGLMMGGTGNGLNLEAD